MREDSGHSRLDLFLLLKNHRGETKYASAIARQAKYLALSWSDNSTLCVYYVCVS
jgi:hypothetical protein